MLTWGQGRGFFTLHFPVIGLGWPQKEKLSSAEAASQRGDSWRLSTGSTAGTWGLSPSFLKGDLGSIAVSTTLVDHKQSWTCAPTLHQAVSSWGTLLALAHKIMEQMLLSSLTSLPPWHFSYLCIFRRPTHGVLCFLSFCVWKTNTKIADRLNWQCVCYFVPYV